jgi:hypothetical protein
MKSDFFSKIRQLEISSKGVVYNNKFPMFYYDQTSLVVLFTASTDRARRYLPHPDMHPIELYPGRCFVTFLACEYRETDVGPYKEFGIGFMVTFQKRQIPGVTLALQRMHRRFTWYFWHIPVTTERARLRGAELYGFPKFIADISFEKEDHQIACNLSTENQRILTLKGKVLPTHAGKITRTITYSVKDGIPLVTNSYVNILEYAETRNSEAAELDIGSGHPICDELKGIQLSRKPFDYQYCPKAQSITFLPRNIIDD